MMAMGMMGGNAGRKRHGSTKPYLWAKTLLISSQVCYIKHTIITPNQDQLFDST
jgi:hypothetical protein